MANPGLVSELPVVILSERFAPFAQRVAGFTEGFLRLGEVYRRDLDKIFQTAGGFGGDAAEIKKLRETFLAKYDKEQNLFKNLDVSGRSYLTDHPDFERRIKAFLEVYADSPARSQVDLKGEMTGMHLLINALPETVQNGVRVFDKNRFGLQISYPSEAYALRTRTVSFVEVKNFKKLIILQLSDDAVSYKAIVDVIARNKEKYGEGFEYYWARWKRREEPHLQNVDEITEVGELIPEGGTEFKAGADVEIMLLGHASPTQIGDFNEEEIAGLISALTIRKEDGTATIGSLTCKACGTVNRLNDFYQKTTDQDGKRIWKLRRDPDTQKLVMKESVVGTGSIPVNLLHELDDLGVAVRDGIKARTEKLVLVGGQSYLSVVDRETGQTFLIYRQNVVPPKEVLTDLRGFTTEAWRIRAWLGEGGSDGPVFYQILDDAPDGTVLNTLDFTQWHGELLSASLKHPIRNIAAELAFPPAFATRKYQAGLELVSLWRNAGDVTLPADASALIVGMHDVVIEGNHRIVISDPDTVRVGGVIAALDLASRSQSADEFIWRAGHHFSQEIASNFRTAMNRFSDQGAALERLQHNIRDDRFSFNTADITTRRGAGFVNEHYPRPFSVVRAELFDASGCSSVSNRRKRQTCSLEEIEEQAREATEGLTLLSDDETRILAGNSADDIALHISEPDSVLARVQDGIHDFRRATISQRISDHEGYHNVIALDEESFAAAQTLARNSDKKGRALKLSTDGRGNPILLTDDGRVVTMVEGGSRNRLSIVGRTETFEGFSASEMAAGVRSLVRGERIGSVSVHPVLEEGEGFRLEESFRELEVSEPSSPWREVADTVRLQALEKKASVVVNGGTSVVEKGHLQAGVPGRSETYLFDGEFFRDALNLGSADQPGTLERQLRDKMEELHRQGRTAEREVYESLTLDYASKLRNLRAQFEVFRAAMDQVYRANNLSFDEDIPLLSSLHQDEKGGWKMEFTDRDMIRAPRVIPIEDERIIRFVHDYNDNIEKVRVTLKLNHELTPESLNRALVEGELLESVEAIDGFGLAMVMQTLIGLAGKDQDELTLKNIKNADYRRALIVHQALGLAFGTKVVLGVALDVGKYVAALLTGKSASIPERLMTRVAASLEKVLGKELSKGAIKGLAKVPRFASGALDGVLTVAFIGVDIDELIHADTPAGKELAKVQLGVDSLSLVFPATSLFLGALSEFGSLSASAAAAASTGASFVADLAVPVGGIIVGIIGLAPNYIQLEAEFDNTMDFFHSVYRDLVFQDTFDPGTGILNLLYREEKSTFGQRGPQRPGPGKLDLSKRSGMLAPVRSIDLDQGVVEYNSINLPKVTGGWGAAIGGY